MKWKAPIAVLTILIVVSMVIANQTETNESINETFNLTDILDIKSTPEESNETVPVARNESVNVTEVNETLESNMTLEEPIAIETLETVNKEESEAQATMYTDYNIPGKSFNIASRNIIIEHESEEKEQILLFNVTSTSDSHLIGDFEETKEWAYEKTGKETVRSGENLVVIGNHICIDSNYVIENKGTSRETKTYLDCIYYPPQYVEKELEKDVKLVQDDGTVRILKAGTIAQQQVRKISQVSKNSVEISFEDDYDPTITELQVGMVSYWTLDTDASDDYGSNDGSNTGADHVAAKIDDGYDFEESDTEDYISISDDNTLDITDAISISFWIKPESLRHSYIVSKYRAYMCQMSDTSGTVQCGIWYDNGGPSWRPMVEDTVGTGWSHIVFTYNSTAGGTQEAKMYVNNSLADTGDYDDSIYTGSYDLGMGNRLTDFARDFDGIVDEVGIWNTALGSDDVSELFNGGDGLQPLDSENQTTIWSREDICPSWIGNSGWNTAEFRAHIDSVSSSYDQVRFKFCAGTDEDLRILNLSVCYTTDSTPSTDETCSDFVTHEGDGATVTVTFDGDELDAAAFSDDEADIDAGESEVFDFDCDFDVAGEDIEIEANVETS